MKIKKPSEYSMRNLHRWLGFFLAGIMSIYAISGIVLIFRTNDTFKIEKSHEKKFDIGTAIEEVGKELRIKDFKVEKEEGDLVYFNNGTFNKADGISHYKTMELPFVLDKLTHIHKATTKDPLFFLNIFFGLSLLFFVISAFWMFLPNSKTFRKGLYFTLAGIVLALIMFLV
jgi:hypothetical protein